MSKKTERDDPNRWTSSSFALEYPWTWAATLLQSSTVAYQFGISGPFWYAAGASIQVLLIAIVALELK